MIIKTNKGDIFIKDNPTIHKGHYGAILDVNLNFKTGEGSFSAPSSTWGGPVYGDLIDVLCASGRELRCAVLTYTQDYVMRKGTIRVISFVEDYAYVLENIDSLIIQL